MNRGEGPECQPKEGGGGGAGWLRRHRFALGLGLLLLLAVVAIAAAALGRGLTLEDLRARREAFTTYVHAHPVLSVEIYLAAYAGLLCLSLPGALIMSLAAGYLFGIVEGAAAAVTALMVAGAAMYGVARGVLGDALRQRLLRRDGLGKKLQEGVDRNAFLSLLSLRLMPALPFALVNLGAAAVRIPFPVYLAATLVGVLPSTLIYVSIGSALVGAFSRSGAPKLSSLITPQVYLPLLGLFVLSAAPLAWKAWTARRGSPPHSRLAGRDGEA